MWYRNLKANPRLVEANPRLIPRFTCTFAASISNLAARDATDEGRAEYWARLISVYPPYKGYRDAADRVIQPVICEPYQAP